MGRPDIPDGARDDAPLDKPAPVDKPEPGGGPRDEDAEADLEEGLEESFPASDPPAVTNPSRPGVPIGEI